MTPCGSCIEGSCCPEIAACKGDAKCLDCLTGAVNPATCMGESKKKLDALNACSDGKCAVECTPPPCNPITNEGCDGDAGEACDHNSTGFSCFPPDNDTPICEPCDNQAGPFCEAGHTCLPDGTCGAFCCDDGDCGTGKCDATVFKLSAGGVCVKKK